MPQIIDLFADEPTFYWTYAGLVDYAEASDPVWSFEVLTRPVVKSDLIRFDVPEDCEQESGNTITLRRDSESGLWSFVAKGVRYEGVLAETASHLVITGTWIQPPDRGVFVLVLPRTPVVGQR